MAPLFANHFIPKFFIFSKASNVNIDQITSIITLEYVS
jgi:hypothetical protein